MIFHYYLIIHITSRVLCKNFFSCDHQRNGKMENIFPSIEAAEQGPVGLPGTEAFLVPISYRQECSLHDLWVPKGRTVANQRRMLTLGQLRPTLLWPNGHKMGCHFFFLGIFLIQELNPSLLYWQVDSLPLHWLGDHLRPCTKLNLATNPILLQLCRGNKNTRLLLPWSLA